MSIQFLRNGSGSPAVAVPDIPPDKSVADFADAFTASDEGEENLDSLVAGKSWCVTTGQQPGLLLGPLYTINKALAVAALAQVLSERSGRHVVPVFWVAGDDHDFAEANHFYLQDSAGVPQRIELRQRSVSDPLLPLYREPVGDAEPLITRLRDTLPDTEFRESLVDRCAAAYLPDRNLADAFVDLLLHFVGRFGVVLLRAYRPEFKRAANGLVLDAVRRGAEIDESLGARAADLEASGSAAPVKVGDGATLAMLEGVQGRDRILLGDNGSYRLRRSGEELSFSDVEGIARTHPQRLSANVLLRPVVESRFLPTLGYIGGPGELAYFPQCKPIYETLGVAEQPKLARWSATIIEKRVRKVLDKYHLEVEQLGEPEGRLETELTRGDLPEQITRSLEELREVLGREFQTLVTAGSAIDPTLERPLKALHGHALSATDGAEKKILSHLKRHNEVLVRQIARVRNDLFPTGAPQERVINPLQYIAKYGDELLDLTYAECLRWAGAGNGGASNE